MTESKTDHPRVMTLPPLIFMASLVGALLLQWLVPLSTPAAFAVRSLGWILVVIGFFLAGWSLAHMLRVKTSPDPYEPTTSIVTSGPYRFTRNPIYLGFSLIYLGATFLAASFWGLILSPLLIWTVTRGIIRPEEAYLESKFQAQYTDYKSRVRRWI
jgi:protein-S-isoprenylcysteine O-methyltransferase Ste14